MSIILSHHGNPCKHSTTVLCTVSVCHSVTVIGCSLLQTVLDISSCLSDNASYSMAGEALTHAVTTVQQVQWSYGLHYIHISTKLCDNLKQVLHV